uniref:DNA-directed DNA polymerase n=1 Tax=Meloidogyne enterolobii TaxID=390850 RepID=A0A6V7XAJ8_MELEN|nr:unnamed protein product [Meloidogyne enterolobii]
MAFTLKQNGKSCIICGNNRSITFSHRPYSQTKVDKQVVTQTRSENLFNGFFLNLTLNILLWHFHTMEGRYDMVMVFREIYLKGVVPSMIRRGNKLYELKIPRNNKCNEVIFRDSYNLCPVALGKLIGAFGLKVTEKQFFPHLANISENYGRTLQQLPPKSDYLYEGMRPENRMNSINGMKKKKISSFVWTKHWRILHKRCADSHRSTDCFLEKNFMEISKIKIHNLKHRKKELTYYVMQ